LKRKSQHQCLAVKRDQGDWSLFIFGVALSLIYLA